MSSLQSETNNERFAANQGRLSNNVASCDDFRPRSAVDVSEAACGQAAIDALRGNALARLDATRDVLRERFETVMAGKAILDAGGDAAVIALSAKQASIDIAAKDVEFMSTAKRALALLDNATLQLQQTSSEQEMKLSVVFSDRIVSYKKVVEMLKESPLSMSMTASESDALGLANAKTQLADGVGSSLQLIRSKTSESLDTIHTKLASIDHASLVSPLRQIPATPLADSMAMMQHLPDFASAHLHDGCKRLQSSVQSQLHTSLQVVSARVDTALAGRQLLQLGGDSAAHALLAKTASISAANADMDAVKQIQTMSAAYEAAAAKLMLAAAHPQGDFAMLAEQYADRAREYEQMAKLLEDPVPTPVLSAAEQDACAILDVKATGASAATRVTDGADTVKSWVQSASVAFPGGDKLPGTDKLSL